MRVYLDLVMVINFLVDFLLLLATDRLCGYPPNGKRAVLAALLGSVYGAACFLPEFRFLGNVLWKTVSLALMTWIAFGVNRGMIRRGAVFVLLSMALGGAAMGVGSGNFQSLAVSFVGLFVLCFLTGTVGKRGFVPVELTYGERQMKITALQDTGNTLRDPVTGGQVLVVGADVAQKLTGLTEEQLKRPVESLGAIPGLRLIPYHAVGQPEGMLLALKFPKVKIGNRTESQLVAFAPDGIGSDGSYQALTGGAV